MSGLWLAESYLQYCTLTFFRCCQRKFCIGFVYTFFYYCLFSRFFENKIKLFVQNLQCNVQFYSNLDNILFYNFLLDFEKLANLQQFTFKTLKNISLQMVENFQNLDDNNLCFQILVSIHFLVLTRLVFRQQYNILAGLYVLIIRGNKMICM